MPESVVRVVVFGVEATEMIVCNCRWLTIEVGVFGFGGKIIDYRM